MSGDIEFREEDDGGGDGGVYLSEEQIFALGEIFAELLSGAIACWIRDLWQHSDLRDHIADAIRQGISESAEDIIRKEAQVLLRRPHN